MRFAIVGAGMAGLSCADALTARGHSVVLFDKSRGPGGRMSTRRMETALGEANFDHGAQYFTARDPGFQSVVADWHARGFAEPWLQAGTGAWVGTPGMSAVIRDMAARHDTRFGGMVRGIRHERGGWRMTGDHVDDGPFDGVVVAVPAEQAVALLGLIDLEMARLALASRSQPCWTAMFAFPDRLATEVVVLRDRGVIGWASRNSAKPGRTGPEAWVVQGNGAWSTDHIETPAADVEGLLLAALNEELGLAGAMPIATAAHRWRYALSAGSGIGALWNRRLNVGVCGDWLLGPRVECAWLSGRRLADDVTNAATRP